MKKIPLRTDEGRFEGLPDYPFLPHYLSIFHPEYAEIRMHYLDEGDSHSLPVLMLHGCPAWSYLYRKVLKTLLLSRQRSLRLIVPDHIGCGKSDKLLERSDYSYEFYVDSIRQLITKLDLQHITLVCQDWGGPIGLRVFSEMPERFARIIATNTLLPNAEPPPRGVADWPGNIIQQWVSYTQQASDMAIGQIIQGVCTQPLSTEVIAAYDAPFPDARYKQGMMNWPSLIPLDETRPGITENRRAWETLEKNQTPFLTAFSDKDPSTIGWENIFQKRVKGAQGQAHIKIHNAGHMVQEDKGEELANIIEQFIFC